MMAIREVCDVDSILVGNETVPLLPLDQAAKLAVDELQVSARLFHDEERGEMQVVAKCLAKSAEQVIRERDALRDFKSYVHKRLDDAGVPVDPESPHKAEGCRIGGRLDWVFAEIHRLQNAAIELASA